MPPLRATPTETSQVRDRAADKRPTRSPFGFRKPIRIYPNLVRSSDTPLSRSDIDASGKTTAPNDQAEEPYPKVLWLVSGPRDVSRDLHVSAPGRTRQPLGPPYPVTRESFRAGPHPRCLPPRSPSPNSEFGGCYPPRVREGKRPCRAAVVRHTGIASTPFLLGAPRP